MKHISLIEAVLVDVAHKWKRIGRALRLRPSTLNQIERNQHDVEDCLSAMLEKLLQRSYDVATFGEPSWSLVVRAVSHGDCALALRIATNMEVMCPHGVFIGRGHCSVNNCLICDPHAGSVYLVSFPTYWVPHQSHNYNNYTTGAETATPKWGGS